MTDTSSSDEEFRKKLLDAVDREFTSGGLFKGEECKKEHTRSELKDVLPPSLRVAPDDNLNSNNSGLNLTPEFRNYVGKQLAAMLDKQLKEIKPCEMKKKKRKRLKNRVKLLHDSCDYIEPGARTAEDVNAVLNAKRKSKQVEVDSEEESAKIKEAVVDGDWLTSGEAIRGWARSTKGEVMMGEHSDSLKTDGGKKTKKKKRKKGQEVRNGVNVEEVSV